MIVGFGIKSISAERKTVPKGRVDISSTPKIVSVFQSETGLLKKQRPLNVEFEFITRYEPKVGEIKIVGNVFYVGKMMKDVLKNWNKEKKLIKDVDIEVKNFLFRKCLTIGVNLSENMQLPPPLMFPSVIPQRAQKRQEKRRDLTYIG